MEWISAPEKTLDFSSNVNPLGMPEAVDHLMEEYREGIFGVDFVEDMASLRSSIAAANGVPDRWVYCGQSVTEIMTALLACFGVKNVLLFSPCFTEYKMAVTQAGGQIRWHELHGEDHWHFDLKRLSLQRIDAVIMGQPNNPTSHAWDRRALLEFAERCVAGRVYLLVDESYVDMSVGGREALSIARELCRLPNVIVLRSFTQSLAIPSFRFSYALVNPIWADMLGGPHPLWSGWLLHVLAEAFDCLAAHWQKTAAWLREELPRQWRRMNDIDGLYAYRAQCNFMLLRTERPVADLLCGLLEKRGIQVRCANSFQGLEGNCYLRVSLHGETENDVLCKALMDGTVELYKRPADQQKDWRLYRPNAG